jgi:hypothetical protein
MRGILIRSRASLMVSGSVDVVGVSEVSMGIALDDVEIEDGEAVVRGGNLVGMWRRQMSI